MSGTNQRIPTQYYFNFNLFLKKVLLEYFISAEHYLVGIVTTQAACISHCNNLCPRQNP